LLVWVALQVHGGRSSFWAGHPSVSGSFKADNQVTPLWLGRLDLSGRLARLLDRECFPFGLPGSSRGEKVKSLLKEVSVTFEWQGALLWDGPETKLL